MLPGYQSVEEVSALLDAVRVRGRPGKWKCVRSAVKAMGMEKKFELLEQRLGQLSREVETERQKLENRMVKVREAALATINVVDG